jgi:AraC-like DNA-binding protein
MELKEFVVAVPGFASLTHPDKILHFGWYQHAHCGKEHFDQATIRACYSKFGMQEPNFSEQFTRLVGKRPKVLLQERAGYKLEHKMRELLDSKYGAHETTIAVSKLLRELPGKVADEAERIFLKEAITCYHSRAFRAAIIMAWNLTYDHMCRWILADGSRLAAFNAQIATRVGITSKRAGIKVNTREEFELLEEKEMIDIMAKASLLPSSNTKKILEIQLTRRNMAAHPSLVSIDAPQADDAITSLVSDIVLVLK